MSVVTNIILNIVTSDEEVKMKEINNYLVNQGYDPMISLDDKCLPRGWYGGDKFLEADLYCGAFNKLDLNEFLEHIKNIDWEGVSYVQVIVQEQDDPCFRSIDVIDNNWKRWFSS